MTIRHLILLSLSGATLLLSACHKSTNSKPAGDPVAAASPSDLNKGLVLYLPFTNGSMADSSGSGNTVTAVSGAGLGYDIHGYAQSAFTADGNGQYLTVSNNGAYAFDTAFSLSFDFMIRSAPFFGGIGSPGMMALISLVDPANGAGSAFHVGMNDPVRPEYFSLGMNSSAKGCDPTPGQSDSFIDTTSFLPQIGSWYNVIVCFSSGVVTIYLNGQLLTSGTTGFDHVLSCPAANVIIGGWWSRDPQSINGEIDEVRMYNRTLNATLIAWLARNFQLHSNAEPAPLQTGKPPATL